MTVAAPTLTAPAAEQARSAGRAFTLVSADSHVTEPGDCYLPYIDPAYRDRAPVSLTHDVMGAAMSVDNGRSVIPYGMVAAAGRSWDQIGPRAILSRATAGTVGTCLVFSLPGSEKAVRLGAKELIAPILAHGVDLVNGRTKHK